jgi:hypothetical protein
MTAKLSDMVPARVGGPRLEGQLGIDLLLDALEARRGRETACDLEVHVHEVRSCRALIVTCQTDTPLVDDHRVDPE